MKPQFSEFTYGYTVVEELSRNGFTAVPTFPTLVEEGRDGGGYDVEIEMGGFPFFLQFKRSDYLSRANAKYHNVFNSPYYRFNLHALRHSRQHNLLLHLERCGNPVFYVAPKFHTNLEMQNHYFARSVCKSSIWIAPTEIGSLPDDDEHSICFNQSESQVYFCSEPKSVEHRMSFQTDTLQRYVSLFRKREGYRKYHRDNWQELYEQMLYVFKTNDEAGFSKLARYLDEDDNIVTKTAKLSRLAFGSDMVIYKS
ncbi:hypothetical protein [Vibrio parahaemolyticus]|uniref:hypothetical protein n=1 Tax=Vibrio parahaemolyticus TaxID=670 RepID=UPI001D1894C9|nr:hypothetical protein [Vibrio parahaemolyticus]MCC4211024.1 hypothetical protein [Vibrio parahaemolyticus]